MLDEFTHEPHTAYFSMEIALLNDIPTYSGGLGILAGDTVRSAADLELPMVAVSLASRSGYFKQKIDNDGHPVERAESWDSAQWAIPLNAKVAVDIKGHPVWISGWLYILKGHMNGQQPIILLDTDPLSKTTFILGKLVPYIVIALLDFYFILGAGWLLFDLPQPSSHLSLFFLALIFVAVMISLGLFISLIAKTQQQAMFLAIFIIIPSILLSGFIFPIEAIPEVVRAISYLIPFTYFVEIIRGLLIKHTLLIDLLPSFLILTGFAITFVVASILKFRKTL